MLQKENLKGKVKTVYVTNGSVSVKIWFDRIGKITKKEETRDWGEVIVWDNYVYDKEGRLMSINAYEITTPDEKSEVTYKYNDDGTRESYNATYTCDERGNCVLEVRQMGQGFHHLERIYNERNQIIEAFTHNGPVRLNIWKTENGKRSHEETQWTEPEKRLHVFFEYNAHGDISLITLKTENGYTTLNEKASVTYNGYDSAGNWLEQIHATDSSDDEYRAYNSYDQYYKIYETYLNGLHIKRTIEYYE